MTGFLSSVYTHPDISNNVVAISVSRKSFSRKLYQDSRCMRVGKNREHVKIRIGEGRVGIVFQKRDIYMPASFVRKKEDPVEKKSLMQLEGRQ